MKNCLVILVTAYLVYFTSAAAQNCTSTVPPAAGNGTAEDFECTQLGLSCTDDCKTLAVCIAKAKPILTMQCPKDRPFCSGRTCSATPDYTKAACRPEFTCTSEGIFPDPSDCTLYRNCPAPNNASVLYQCPTGYAFNSKAAACSWVGTNLPRNRVDCSNPANANSMVLYDGHAAYYAFCFINSLIVDEIKIYMYKCQDELNEVYDLSLGQCVYNCTAAGNFKDRTDCNGYYCCSAGNDGKLVANKVACPANFHFSGSQCVAQNAQPCVSELPAPLPWKKPKPTNCGTKTL